MTADQWREAAARYERLADAAERDGDPRYANCAKQYAADCRQNARLREVGDD
jgi:hypothetical protein